MSASLTKDLLPGPLSAAGATSSHACRLCGSGNVCLLIEAQGYPILQCRRCGVAFTGLPISPRRLAGYYRQEYYALSASYAEDRAREASQGVEGDYGLRVRDISRLARRKSGTVLDIGCGGGALLASFSRAGWRCCGIEPSAEMASHARRVVNCRVLECTLEDAELPADSFDVVTTLHVLEHSPDPRVFLDRCRHLLKPGGMLMVEVPDFGSRNARRQRQHWEPLYPGVHLYHFTQYSLSRLLKQVGFRVVQVRRCGGLGPLAVARNPGLSDSPVRKAWTEAALDRARARIFEFRHQLYQVPGLRRALRFVVWHLLGMNDFLRFHAIRAPERSFRWPRRGTGNIIY